MTIIEIEALENGAHNNVTYSTPGPIPTGWAIVPVGLEIPATFPFVNITVDNDVITSITGNQDAFAKAVSTIEEPSQLDAIEAQVMYTALVTDSLITDEEV